MGRFATKLKLRSKYSIILCKTICFFHFNESWAHQDKIKTWWKMHYYFNYLWTGRELCTIIITIFIIIFIINYIVNIHITNATSFCSIFRLVLVAVVSSLRYLWIYFGKVTWMVSTVMQLWIGVERGTLLLFSLPSLLFSLLFLGSSFFFKYFFADRITYIFTRIY